MNLGSTAACPAARRQPDGSRKPDRRTPSRSVSGAIDHAAAVERRCLRAERIVLTAVAAAVLVLFCAQGACFACNQDVPRPAAPQTYGWPI
jgi:hypothetical protein